MPRSYVHVKSFEKDIFEMKASGKSNRETECIYRHKIQTFDEARFLIDEYIWFYNNERIQLKTKLTPLEKRRQSA